MYPAVGPVQGDLVSIQKEYDMRCPVCGNVVHVWDYSEYIGDRPMGGFQTFYEFDVSCECVWTDEQMDDLINEAEKSDEVTHK